MDFTDYDDRGPLHVAAANGSLEVCKFLLKKGVSLDSEDKYGRKPIVDALLNGHMNVIVFLSKEGSEVEC